MIFHVVTMLHKIQGMVNSHMGITWYPFLTLQSSTQLANQGVENSQYARAYFLLRWVNLYTQKASPLELSIDI